MLRSFVMFALLVLLVLVAPSRDAAAEPPAPLDDRVAILEVEMSRVQAKRLAPYLTAEAHPLSRHYAIRALGRMGEHSGAPKLLEALLEAGGPDLEQVLWSAGICQAKSLGEAIAAHLGHKDEKIVVAAAQALGWTGWAGAPTTLAGLLVDKRPRVRAAALVGLSRTRADVLLERCIRFVEDDNVDVVSAALDACWLMAATRRGKAKAADEDWDGDAEIAKRIMPLLISSNADHRMGALRILGSMLPEKIERMPVALAKRAEDADARVVQDFVWRILTRRKGAAVDTMLRRLLGHSDLKVRLLCIEALATREGAENKQALTAAYDGAKDWRLRCELAIALAHHGDRRALRAISTTAPAPGEDVAVHDTLRFRGAKMLPDEEAVAVLIGAAPPHLLDGDSLHGAAWFACFDALEGKEDERIAPWLAEVLSKCRSQNKYFIYGAGCSLAGANGYLNLLQRHLTDATKKAPELAADAALGLLGGLEKAVSQETWSEGFLAAAKAFCTALDEGHPSNFVQDKVLAVSEAALAKGHALDGIAGPDNPGTNDWQGLPRPKGEFLGQTWGGDSPWLTTREIAQIAATLHEAGPGLSAARIRFETTQGTFVVELATDEAHAHVVNAALAAHRGLWDGTRFHRVVPNFVIQGGDPYGHGAGDAGYSVPDEINPLRYTRGAVGMPKSRKDDGGCQIFVMHTTYRPLDERYTVFGRVIEGMEVVDKIRVGDRVRRATLITAASEGK